MHCEQVTQQLHEALDGAATPMQLAQRLPLEVHRHLEQCAACRRTAHELLALDDLLSAALTAPPHPPQFDAVAAAMARLATAPAVDPWVALEAADFWKEAVPPLPSPARAPLLTPLAAVLLCAACGWLAGGVAPDAGVWLEALGTGAASVVAQAQILMAAAVDALATWSSAGLSACPNLPALYSALLCAALLCVLTAANWRWSQTA